MSKGETLLQLLKGKGLTLGSVESITAGLFGASICQISGASKVYRGGLITYQADLKTKLAHVPSNEIKECGVVSLDVASSMAEGGADALKVDLCLSCTGNAGPTAEPGEAPVGRVCIASYYRGEITSIALDLKGERNEIRNQVVQAMIDLGIEALKENSDEI